MIDWAQWHSPPFLADVLVGLAWLYALLAGPFRHRLAPGRPWPRAESLRFYSGLALFYLAVASPLARIGEFYLFFVHVALQMAVAYAVAPLVLRGLPAWMIDALLAHPAGRPVWSRLFRPLCTGAIFVLLISGWYVPRVFGWARTHPAGPAIEGLLYLLASLLFWWPLLSPSRLFPAIGYGGRLIYLFAVEVAMSGIFTYLLMSEHSIYPVYEFAPRLIPGLGAENDQVLGGVLVSAISSLVLVGVLLANFLAWSRSDGSAGSPRSAVSDKPPAARRRPPP